MKRLVFLLLMVPALSWGAGITLPQVFTNATGAKNASRTAVYDMSAYKTKTLFVYGKYSSSVYLNLSSTVRAKCGASKFGPFTTCKQSQLASTPQIVITSNGHMTWQDAAQWVQIQYIRAKRAVNVWLSGNPN